MAQTRMRLRSAVPPEERELEKKKPKVNKEIEENLPFITYKGKLKYSTTLIDCASDCDKILSAVNETDDLFYIGFDLEWPFSFQTGPGKTAVVQMSPNLDMVYILHISELRNLPKALTELLIHPRVRLVGVNIKNDIRKLARDFSGVDGDRIVENCIDCGVLANTILPLTQRWSMEKLVKYVLKLKINKDKKVRMSKWHIIPLSRAQQVYAAIDAYASLQLYYKLMELKINDDQKEQDMNQMNSENGLE